MRPRKTVIGLLALAGFVVLAVVVWPEKRELAEPVYKGKKLGEWLDMQAAFFDAAESANAMQAIGTNGIPCYLHWIAYEPNVPKKMEYYLRSKAGLTGVSPDWDAVRAVYALNALRRLGEDGAPAIPELLAYAKRRPTFPPYYGIVNPENAMAA